eukprot:TRINITY_DN4461_c0_g1_i2.p1 TRINITY_DN4461_c0_g1~~TRINITY_DN4461_c0_g1_i2.p1  ORF type:complete len:108 (-),score=12.33 TRINITY_DN4461_c0_g1_i2:171-494(-)
MNYKNYFETPPKQYKLLIRLSSPGILLLNGHKPVDVRGDEICDLVSERSGRLKVLTIHIGTVIDGDSSIAWLPLEDEGVRDGLENVFVVCVHKMDTLEIHTNGDIRR